MGAESLNVFFTAFILLKIYGFRKLKLKCKKNVFPAPSIMKHMSAGTNFDATLY